MAKKTSKAKSSKVGVTLPPVTDLMQGQSFATSRAVTADDAMELIARGWVLTQSDDNLIVVACPHDVHEEGQ